MHILCLDFQSQINVVMFSLFESIKSTLAGFFVYDRSSMEREALWFSGKVFKIKLGKESTFQYSQVYTSINFLNGLSK